MNFNYIINNNIIKSILSFSLPSLRFASHKTGGTVKNGRGSQPKFLGLKKFGDEHVIAGNIIVRQRGLRWKAGDGVVAGKDHTLVALREGYVKFNKDRMKRIKTVSIVNAKQNIHTPPLPPKILSRREIARQRVENTTTKNPILHQLHLTLSKGIQYNILQTAALSI